MKPSAANRTSVLVVAGVAAVVASACLWLCAPFDSAPDEALLIRRMQASISLGWGWLRAKDMRVVACEKKGRNYAVTFSYSVLVDQDEAALPPEERERFRRFLPMCSALPIARGTICPLQEEMLFADTREYGWMPEPFIRHRPELLPAIADRKEPAP